MDKYIAQVYELLGGEKWGMIAEKALAKPRIFSQRICASSTLINIAKLYLQKVAPTYSPTITVSKYLFPHIPSLALQNKNLQI